MANSADNASDLDYADKLWQAADKLRGTVDAAEYKHVVLGLIFLKYISDSFESRRAKLKEELEKDGIKGPHLESLSKAATNTPPSASSGCRRRPAGRTCKTRPSAPTSPH